MAVPRIANVQCSRLQFQPGDKVIVRVYQKLGKTDKARLMRTVQRWAEPAEVLLVDTTLFDLDVVEDKEELFVPGKGDNG